MRTPNVYNDKETLDKAVIRVSYLTGVSVEKIKSPSRKRDSVKARSIAAKFAREFCGMELREVGHYFGKRDQSSIGSCLRKLEEDYQSDKAFKQEYDRIWQELIYLIKGCDQLNKTEIVYNYETYRLICGGIFKSIENQL